MIFKVQIPLNTIGGEPVAYVYNKDRAIEFYTDVKNVSHLFENGVYKIYVDGIAAPAKDDWQLLVLEQVEEQNW